MYLLSAIVLVLALAALAVGAGWWCMNMPGPELRGGLPPPGPDQQQLAERLSGHVHVLAEEIGERHHNEMEQLNRAADYISAQLRAMGYVPAVRQFGDRLYRNVVVELHGRDRGDEIIVVGAHYDTTWMTPGADDNASGVAGLLELARNLYGQRFRRTVRLVAFANEEEPFYGTSNMGSRVNARRARDAGDNIVAMFSLEMIGYYSEEPGSQRYPRPIRRFYPDTADFIAFVSNLSSSPLLRRSVALFREQQVFPAEGMAAPEFLVPDIRRSDNASFWRYGYAAVMITDTGNYRNWNYHNVGDTHRSLDYAGMARVVTGLTGLIRGLAGGPRE
jgi:hypothetical protein